MVLAVDYSISDADPIARSVRPCGSRHRRVPGHRPGDCRRPPRRRRQRRDYGPRSGAPRRGAREAVGRTAAAMRVHAVRADVGKQKEAAAAVAGAIDDVRRARHPDQQRRRGALRATWPTWTPRRWHQVIDTNLSGVFFCCHAAIPAMRQRGGGWIVNISSLAGTNPFESAAAYCASKAGLNAFSEALMQEVRHDNIRVSCVVPGSVATGFGRGGRRAGRLEARARGRRAGRARSARASCAEPAEPRGDPARRSR